MALHLLMPEYSQEARDEVRRLKANGLSYQEISRLTGHNRTTILRWCDPLQAARQLQISREAKRRRKKPCPRCGRLKGYEASEDAVCTVCANHQNKKWTRENVIKAIQLWAEEHDGKPPRSTDWNYKSSHKRDRRFPTITSVYGPTCAFKSWADAIEAAGFPRPRVGRPPRVPKFPGGKPRLRQRDFEAALIKLRQYHKKRGIWPRPEEMFGTYMTFRRAKVSWDEALALAAKENDV
jgi:hypothetical protein